METLRIEVPIDYYIHCGITEYNKGSAIISKRLTDIFDRPIVAEIGTQLSIDTTDLELCLLIISALQEQQRKLSNSLMDLDQAQGKALLRYLIGVHNLEVLNDTVIVEILIFVMVQICRYLKVPLEILKDRMDEVYAKSKEILKEVE